jgi:hypothetical protein
VNGMLLVADIACCRPSPIRLTGATVGRRKCRPRVLAAGLKRLWAEFALADAPAGPLHRSSPAQPSLAEGPSKREGIDCPRPGGVLQANDHPSCYLVRPTDRHSTTLCPRVDAPTAPLARRLPPRLALVSLPVGRRRSPKLSAAYQPSSRHTTCPCSQVPDD